MTPILSVENMRASDEATFDKIPSLELMRRAGEGIFSAVKNWPAPVAICCGSGNNAGDGYVLALLLNEAGVKCHIFLLAEKFSVDGKFYFDQCLKQGISWSVWNGDSLGEYASIVDCLFGTGFRGAISGKAAELVVAINSSGAYVVSADINSGLHGDSGDGECYVKSDLTVSIGYFQPGHFLQQAKDARRALVNCDIGIEAIVEPYWLWDEADAAAALGVRKECSHKGDYGYVTLLGGSELYAGAIKLANLACCAIRSGAGVVRLAAPSDLKTAIMPCMLESTYFPMATKDGLLAYDEGRLDELLVHQKAVAFGMGVGRAEEINKILRHLLLKEGLTLIIDADGLYSLATGEALLDALKRRSSSTILTPHMLEFSRLTGAPVEDILKNPIRAAKEFAIEYGVTLLLKGPTTILTDGNRVFLSDRGCSGMATAGSGDVLSGALLGMAGYIADPLAAATTAAYITGMAGEMAQQDKNPISMSSADTANYIEKAITRVVKG